MKPPRKKRKAAAAKLLPAKKDTNRLTALLRGVAKQTQAELVARGAVDPIYLQILTLLKQPTFTEKLAAIAKSIWRNNGIGLGTVIGIDVREASGLNTFIDKFVERNLTYIQDMVEQQATRLQDILIENIGVRHEDIAAKIQEATGVAESRADLIARDQVLKLNAGIARNRQTSAGITRYVWTTSGDERVREEHAALEGQIFSWDSPPPPGHPGEDIQCRCIAYPLIEGIDE